MLSGLGDCCDDGGDRARGEETLPGTTGGRSLDAIGTAERGEGAGEARTGAGVCRCVYGGVSESGGGSEGGYSPLYFDTATARTRTTMRLGECVLVRETRALVVVRARCGGVRMLAEEWRGPDGADLCKI